jgi:hypothetical protein
MAGYSHRRLLTGIALAAALLAAPAHADDELVYFLTPESETLFAGASEKADFWPLIASFVSENKETFCGVASSVMVLNALNIPAPLSPSWYPNNFWNQDNIFTLPVLQNVESVQMIEEEGLTLDQVSVLLQKSGAKTVRTFASDSTLEKFRQDAIAALKDGNSFLVVNVAREVLGQGEIEGGGHVSPIGAYNAEADRFLFLDVARYKYKPSWITAERLFRAMNTIDTTSKKTRGYVVVSK